jgi:hypothetical protein
MTPLIRFAPFTGSGDITNPAITQRARVGGPKAWLVRFEDNQVPKLSCVAVCSADERLLSGGDVITPV